MLPDEYILDNVDKWSDQKGYVKEHHKVTIWQILNETVIYICDPEMVNELVTKNANILSKISQPGKYMFPSNLEQQVLSMENSKDHVQRRKECLRNLTAAA